MPKKPEIEFNKFTSEQIKAMASETIRDLEARMPTATDKEKIRITDLITGIKKRLQIELDLKRN